MEKEDDVCFGANSRMMKVQEAILKLGQKEKKILENVDLSALFNPENKIYFKAEEIGKFMGKGWNGTKINQILTEMEYQMPFKNDYLPTNLGVKSGCLHRAILIEYGEKKVSFKFSIMWTIDVVDRIREFLNKKESEEKENGTK